MVGSSAIIEAVATRFSVQSGGQLFAVFLVFNVASEVSQMLFDKLGQVLFYAGRYDLHTIVSLSFL